MMLFNDAYAEASERLQNLESAQWRIVTQETRVAVLTRYAHMIQEVAAIGARPGLCPQLARRMVVETGALFRTSVVPLLGEAKAEGIFGPKLEWDAMAVRVPHDRCACCAVQQ